MLTALLTYGAFAQPDADRALTVAALIGGAVVGAITGALVIRSTSVRVRRRARARCARAARGSPSRSGSSPSRCASPRASRSRRLAPASPGGVAQFFALNAGLVALVTAAFAVVALGFHRAIVRYGAQSAGVPASRTL